MFNMMFDISREFCVLITIVQIYFFKSYIPGYFSQYNIYFLHIIFPVFKKIKHTYFIFCTERSTSYTSHGTEPLLPLTLSALFPYYLYIYLFANSYL